jgi:general secretion pathway protein A
MPVETLENIRMLSNLETSTDKLIQIVFCGQPEFEQKLERKELRQLKQRIAVKATIRPLTAEESRAYILHRLQKASAESTTLFTDGAVRKIVKEAHGIPRLINILCENSFITALGYRKGRITSGIVQEVISDFSGKKKGRILKTALVSLALVLAILSSFFIYTHTEPGRSVTGKNPASPTVENKNADSLVMPVENVSKVSSPEETSLPDQPIKELRSPAKSGFPVIRIVKAGDTLSRLVREVYGVSSKELLIFVRENNPGIYDADRIVIGEQILFPARK